MKISLQYISRLIKDFPVLLALALCVLAGPAFAFDSSHYPEQSVLSTGKWVKVSVENDGLYMLSASTLRGWGFTDPMKVRVYGTGGRRMADKLTTANYPGDLPLLQTANSSAGVVFYACGAGEWQKSGQTWIFDPNIYSTRGYYFVTENADVPLREIPVMESEGVPSNPATSFYDRIHHERELFSPGYAGPLLLGEDFRYTPRREFTFSLPGHDGTKNTLISCNMVTNYSKSGSRMVFTANGEELPLMSYDIIGTSSSSSYVHGTSSVSEHTVQLEPGVTQLKLGVELKHSGTPTLAALNYLTVNYPRELSMPDEGFLCFSLTNPEIKLEAPDAASLTVWDVTDPLNIVALKAAGTDNSAFSVKLNNFWRLRNFAAFTPSARLASPKGDVNVANQNLHALTDVDMVIVAPADYIDQAERLANFHRTSANPLKVVTTTPSLIYNEFSSGVPDPAGIRNFFKMLYDRTDGRFQYAVLMGRMTCDNRGLTSDAPNYPTIPGYSPWAVRTSLSDNEGYFTDDVIAMLADNSGTDLGHDKLSIMIGRIPVTDEMEAKAVIDKTLEYATNSRKSAWKHRFMFLADDGDRGEHLRQTENMISYFANQPGQNQFINKVYLASFIRKGQEYPAARERQFKALDEGVVWWNFIGHANTTGWTADNQLTYTDLNNMYLRHLPFIYASTCNFLRLDAIEVSGAEIVYKERYGGAIGLISATRPVYISDNGHLSRAMGRAMAKRNDDGTLLTPGQIYMAAKNDIRNLKDQPMNDTNRLRYVFLGDPALPLAMPSNTIRIDSINGTAPGGDDQIIIAALQQATICGTVLTPSGEPATDFNGIVNIDIFDAEHTSTSVNDPEEDGSEVFEEYGNRVYTGAAKVQNGSFTLSASMPLEFEQNFRPATMSVYAYADNSNAEAVSLFRDFYVFGFDESAPADTVAPTIDMLVLNHSSFTSGDAVNSTPMLIASVSDNVGLNVSTSGVGHQMTAVIDGRINCSDLSSYYTPAADGSPSGNINYSLPELQEGPHQLMLRIWDTSGNASRAIIDFTVSPGMAPNIYEVYSDANPASTSANFFLSHDQPDAMVTVTIEVFNLMGSPVWSSSVTGRSDMFLSVPVTWNLTDRAGRRVNRGIYVYRATVTTDNQNYTTASRKIAVTAQ